MDRAAPELRRWIAALVLMMPAAIPYAVHVLEWKPYSLPTGYIQPDMPIYMAKARETFDDGRFHVFYANPCDGSSTGPRIYFQPWTFALGLVHGISGWRPGALFVAFWFLAAWAASRAAIALYEELVGLDGRSKRLGLIAFLWGGGLLAAAGALRGLFLRGSVSWNDLVAFDPARGWWFLNLGRNLVYPTEALYHAMAFASLLHAMRGSYGRSLLLAAITATCSPFAGLEILAILWLGGLLELAVGSDRRRAAGFLVGVNGLVLGFLSYYVGYLGRFPEHRALAGQMALTWRYTSSTCLLAYGPVLAMTAWRVRSPSRAKTVFADHRARMLLAWAVAAVALENHDLIVAPRQPIHFTRGYAWSALFLLGAPPLLAAFDRIERLHGARSPVFRILLLAAILSDNLTWFIGIARDARTPDRNGLRLTTESRDVLKRLDQDDLLGHLVISEDERLSYLALAETRLASWVGHYLETPNYSARRREVEQLISDGRYTPAWEGRPLVVIRYRRAGEPDLPPWVVRRGVGRPLYENRKFQVLQIPAATNDLRASRTERSVD